LFTCGAFLRRRAVPRLVRNRSGRQMAPSTKPDGNR
jgi:hypothetical protein